MKNLKGPKSCKSHRFGETKLPNLQHQASLYKDWFQPSSQGRTTSHCYSLQELGALPTVSTKFSSSPIILPRIQRYKELKLPSAADALSRSSLEEPDLTLLHQVLICEKSVLPLLLQFCRCAAEKDVPTQDQLDGHEDVEGVVHQ